MTSPECAPSSTLAGVLWPNELESAVAEAFALRLTNRDTADRCDLDEPRSVAAWPGFERCSRLTTARPGDAFASPSGGCCAMLRDAGLPEPETNVRIGRWEVDFLWRDAGFVLEVDAYSTHSSPWAFERDRRKSAELEDLGLTVHRVTRRQLDLNATPTIARVRRAVARNSAE